MPRPHKITFEGSGGARLAGVVDLPDEPPSAYALFAHCFTCTKDLKAAHWIGRTLAAHGIALLRFDFAGLGGSEGDFASSSLSSNLEDLRAAVDHLRREHGPPRLMVGHSLGGAAVLATAGDIPEVRAVATIATTFDPTHLRRYLEPHAESDPAPESFGITIAGRQFRLRRSFLEDLERHDLGQKLHDLGRALLVFHSPDDQVVEVAQATRIFKAARHPKSFVSLAGADHLLSRREDAAFVGRLIAAWAPRYIG